MTTEAEKREFEAGIDWVARTNEAGKGFLLNRHQDYVYFLASMCWKGARKGKVDPFRGPLDDPELNAFLAGVEVGRKMLL